MSNEFKSVYVSRDKEICFSIDELTRKQFKQVLKWLGDNFCKVNLYGFQMIHIDAYDDDDLYKVSVNEFHQKNPISFKDFKESIKL